MTGSDERDLSGILTRMSRRERVLRDQSDSLRKAFASKERLPLAVIDMESNGLAHSTYPIEIGYARGSGIEPNVTGSMLIRPRDSWDRRAAGNASGINGIDPDDLDDALEADRVCDMLDDLLMDMDVVCDGGAHDRYWLNRLYDGRTPAFTIHDVEEATAPALKKMREEADLAHRAGPDSIWLYRAIRIARGKKEA